MAEAKSVESPRRTDSTWFRPIASVVVALSEIDYGRVRYQLQQLSRQQTKDPFEVLIADNGGHWNLCTTEVPVPGIRVVNASDRRGAGYARNVAAAGARGRYLLFCDADDLVAPGWVEAHVAALEEYPFTSGPLCSITYRSTAWSQAVHGCWPDPAFSTSLRAHEGIPFATSANLGIRAEAFWEVGGFPEAYLRSQDVALSMALRQESIEPSFVPGAQVLKAEKVRSRRGNLKLNYERGRARVRLSRDFGVGPPPRTLTLRCGGRLVRICLPKGERKRGAFETEFWQLCGVVRQTTSPKGQANPRGSDG